MRSAVLFRDGELIIGPCDPREAVLEFKAIAKDDGTADLQVWTSTSGMTKRRKGKLPVAILDIEPEKAEPKKKGK